MLSKLRKQQDGFTIIEVLIVLAIAGLIMLIVFLAVPALQRTARNTQRKSAVSSILSSISNFTSNNGGTLPASQADLTTNTPPALADYKPGFYPLAQVYYGGTVATGAAAPSTSGVGNATTLTADDVIVYVGDTCTSQTAQATSTGASTRSVAVEYALEASSGFGTLQCQSS